MQVAIFVVYLASHSFESGMPITGTVVSLLPWKVKRGTPVEGAILKPFWKEPNWGAMAAYTVVGCVCWLIFLRRMARLLIIRFVGW